ncbi:polyisoprenoid diphosphate/phosphate phosphohydrolase PLPP6-like [Amblyomma americanum]
MSSWKQHPVLVRLKAADEQLSSGLFLAARKDSPLAQYRPLMQGLEYSAHGIPWLLGTCTVIWFVSDRELEAFHVNLLLALVLDLIAVACIKAAARRKRPLANRNDMFFTVSVDNHSFPSGHASRVIFLACLFLNCTTLNIVLKAILLAWSLSVVVSRVLLGRHFVGDVTGGAILGLIEYVIIMNIFWMGTDTALSFASYFTTFDSLHGGIKEVEV